MTEQNQTEMTGFEAPRPRSIVYIRPVAVADLPDEVQAQVEDVDTLYAIGDEDGQQLALVKDRALAFMVARQNDLVPLSVH